MPAKKAFGTFLQVVTSTGPTVYTSIANVTDLTLVDASADIIDASSHDSPNEWREKLAGLKDAGDIQLELNYDPAATTHQKVEDILAIATDFKILYVGTPAGRAAGALSAICKSFKTGAPHDGKLTATAVLAVSGKVTWS